MAFTDLTPPVYGLFWTANPYNNSFQDNPHPHDQNSWNIAARYGQVEVLLQMDF